VATRLALDHVVDSKFKQVIFDGRLHTSLTDEVVNFSEHGGDVTFLISNSEESSSPLSVRRALENVLASPLHLLEVAMPVCDLIHSSSVFVVSTINFIHVSLVFASFLFFLSDLSTLVHEEVLHFLLRSHLSLEPFVSDNIVHSESVVGFLLSHANNEVKGVFSNV
jgi:hypothetical protein